MPKAPLPDEVIRQMMEMRSAGCTYEAIAVKFGVTPHLVRYYIVVRPASTAVLATKGKQQS